MRLRGIMPSTSVQADRQLPSMTTRSPDERSMAKASQVMADLAAAVFGDAHGGGGGVDDRRQHSGAQQNAANSHSPVPIPPGGA